MKTKYTIPIFLPELACPFKCVFCDQKNISGVKNIPSLLQIKNTIEERLAVIPKKAERVEIAFFGGNFTRIEEDFQEECLALADRYVDGAIVNSIRLSTRPDYINEKILNRLKNHKVKNIELGAQSMDDEVLTLSKRGHSSKDIEIASNLVVEYGFKLGLQMMIGLPGDNEDRALYTADRIIELGAVETRIYPALVIKGTKLAALYLQKKYNPLSIEEAVKITKKVYIKFLKAKVGIIRVGLHPSEDLLNGGALIAGPFLPNFRELVLTEIWKDKISSALGRNNYEKIIVNIGSGEINYAVGYRGLNRKYFAGKGIGVKFAVDDSLPRGEFQIINQNVK